MLTGLSEPVPDLSMGCTGARCHSSQRTGTRDGPLGVQSAAKFLSQKALPQGMDKLYQDKTAQWLLVSRDSSTSKCDHQAWGQVAFRADPDEVLWVVSMRRTNAH